ncbi:TPA: serine acetyltransferase [Escherichia coli]|nr:serine acetyltransferase [Escherichia coli]HBN7185673.1 serine acetyltransferase [Escherichia coli]
MDILRYKLLCGDETNLKYRDYLKIFSPRLFCVFLYRTSSFFYQKRMKLLSKFFSLINFLLFKVEISPLCSIGGGLFLPHPISIVIGANSIGENCTIFQNVTIGAKTLDIVYNRNVRPLIGNNVTISAGAVVVGPVAINDNVFLGANCVVVNSIESGVIVGGVPAKILGKLTL